MGDIRKMFDPKTVALIGASERPDSPGRIILENLIHSGRQSIFPVNPLHGKVLDLTCYPHIEAIPDHIDLAVIATKAGVVAKDLEECGKAGVEGAIILSAGSREDGSEGREWEEELEEVREKYGMPVLGPNCLGLIRPNIGLNASALRVMLRPGNIAFISQGNRISDAIVDWAVHAHIGFSIFASLGSMVDVGFGELIDIVGDDDETRSIMLYMENIGNARRFLSAARGFARSKPIVVMKSGIFAKKTSTDDSRTTVLSRCDQVYDAAFKRAGVVRVKEVADLLNVSQVLNAKILPKGPKLTIITNAEDTGVIAEDTLLLLHGKLAQLSKETIGELDAFLPPQWSKNNPVYISEDADIARFIKTIEICVKDPDTNGILVIHAARATEEQTELAKAIAGLSKKAYKPILCTILGGKNITDAIDLLRQSAIPAYGTPEEAVRTYLYMYKYKRNLELLYETPPELSEVGLSPKIQVKKLIVNALGKGETTLIADESSSLLAAYGVPSLKPVLTKSIEEARRVADGIGYPLFLKAELSAASPVEKNLVAWALSPEELEKSYVRLEGLAHEQKSGATIAGITVRKMLEEIDYQVRVGSKKDRDFGSVLFLGMGGPSAGILRDFSVGLPPLNHILARRLMEETMLFRALPHPSSEIFPSYFRELEDIIVGLSNLIIDFPEISEIDINPIAISNGKAYILDAKIVLEDDHRGHHFHQYSHLVISPYPTRYTAAHNLADGAAILLRPIKPEDERLYLEMLNSLTEETMRKRFFGLLKDLTHDMMAHFCNVDYDREIAMVAEVGSGDERRIIGVGTLIVESSSKSGQFAILVHDDYHGKGLGSMLMDTILQVGRDKELEEIYGMVLTENNRMMEFCRKMGFTGKFLCTGINRVTLDLR